MAEVKNLRLGALRRFAVAITLLNVFGHTLLGFEQAWATPIVGVLTAYATEILLEILTARRFGRKPRFLAGGTAPIDFLLAPHISGLAVSMLLYANDRLWPVAFAAAVAIASKYVFRVGLDGRNSHIYNPSNIGITATLLAFPWVGIAQPYMFTENLRGGWDWFLPGLIVCTGSLLNTVFTKRMPLIFGWLSVFALQAVVRHLVLDSSLPAALNPMTGVAFLLFTFYMVTDPPTTPSTRWAQFAFGGAVALTYGCLMAVHVVFGLFFALSIVCTSRGLLLWARGLVTARQEERLKVPVPAGVQGV